MKQVILDVLEDVSHGQVNLESEAAREMIVNLIMASIKDKGWYLDLGSHDDSANDDSANDDSANDDSANDDSANDDKLNTAGMPIEKIDKWLTRDIDEAVMIDEYKDIVEDLDESDMEKKMTWEDSIKEEQEAMDSWVCGICNKSTYDVDVDYIGSGTNHLECELKQESKKLNEEKKYK